MGILTARSEAIEATVQFEYDMSNFLCIILGLDQSTSRAFGNTQSAFGFIDKLILLTDLNIFDENEKKKFWKLGEIRNKFAHVKDISTFTKCFEKVEIKIKFWNELYLHKKNLDAKLSDLIAHYNASNIEEEKNGILFNILITDLTKIIENNIMKVKIRSPEYVKNLPYMNHNQSFIP